MTEIKFQEKTHEAKLTSRCEKELFSKESWKQLPLENDSYQEEKRETTGYLEETDAVNCYGTIIWGKVKVLQMRKVDMSGSTLGTYTSIIETDETVCKELPNRKGCSFAGNYC